MRRGRSAARACRLRLPACLVWLAVAATSVTPSTGGACRPVRSRRARQSCRSPSERQPAPGDRPDPRTPPGAQTRARMQRARLHARRRRDHGVTSDSVRRARRPAASRGVSQAQDAKAAPACPPHDARVSGSSRVPYRNNRVMDRADVAVHRSSIGGFACTAGRASNTACQAANRAWPSRQFRSAKRKSR